MVNRSKGNPWRAKLIDGAMEYLADNSEHYSGDHLGAMEGMLDFSIEKIRRDERRCLAKAIGEVSTVDRDLLAAFVEDGSPEMIRGLISEVQRLARERERERIVATITRSGRAITAVPTKVSVSAAFIQLAADIKKGM